MSKAKPCCRSSGSELRAKDSHGGDEPAEKSVDPLNASDQDNRIQDILF